MKPKANTLAPPWQCSRPGWMGLWATQCGGRGLCPWQGGGMGRSRRSLL